MFLPHHLTAHLRAAGHFARHRELAAATTHIVSGALGEPVAEARRIARKSFIRNATFLADFRWLANATPGAVRRRVDAIEQPDTDDLRRVLGGAETPLLIVSLHMGHYLSGLLRLLQALPGVRRVTLVKRARATATETAAHRHFPAGVHVDVLRLDATPGRQARRALTAGSALLLMQDVPPTFGITATRTAPLFGLPLQLPEGPARLAVAAGARVLPIINWCDSGGEHNACAPIIDARRGIGETPPAATARVHAVLGRYMERSIRAHPENWMLWPHLPAFAASPTETATSVSGARSIA